MVFPPFLTSDLTPALTFLTLSGMSKRVALGPAIRAIRTAKGLPGGKFAVDCLMSHAHLCNIEAGRREPTPEGLARIAQALDVPLDAISIDIADHIRSAA